MTTLLMIVLLGGLVYLIRLAGFLLPRRLAEHQVMAGFTHTIPIATLAALSVGGIHIKAHSDWWQVAVIVTTGLIALRTKQLGWSVLAGLALLWIVSYLGP